MARGRAGPPWRVEAAVAEGGPADADAFLEALAREAVRQARQGFVALPDRCEEGASGA